MTRLGLGIALVILGYYGPEVTDYKMISTDAENIRRLKITVQIALSMQVAYTRCNLRDYLYSLNRPKLASSHSIVKVAVFTEGRHEKRVLRIDALGVMYLQHVVAFKPRKERRLGVVAISPIVKLDSDLPTQDCIITDEDVPVSTLLNYSLKLNVLSQVLYFRSNFLR